MTHGDHVTRPEPISLGRSETHLERCDRNLVELLQEVRVVQTGVQVLFAFLLTAPLTSAFPRLGIGQRIEYFVTLAQDLADRHGCGVLVLCGPSERELARQIAVRADRPAVCSLAAVNWGGYALRQRSSACGQRGAKRQPGGRSKRAGGCPSMA